MSGRTGGSNLDNALQGNFIKWLVETGQWDKIPADVQAGSERAIANWVSKRNDATLRQFGRWLSANDLDSRIPLNYFEEDGTTLAKPERVSQGGRQNRVSTNDTITLVGDLRGKVLAELPRDNQAKAFINSVLGDLRLRAGEDGTTVTVGQFVDAVKLATKDLDPASAKWINDGMTKFIANDAQEGSIVSGELLSGSQTGRPQFNSGDVLNLDHVMKLLEAPLR